MKMPIQKAIPIAQEVDQTVVNLLCKLHIRKTPLIKINIVLIDQLKGVVF